MTWALIFFSTMDISGVGQWMKGSFLLTNSILPWSWHLYNDTQRRKDGIERGNLRSASGQRTSGFSQPQVTLTSRRDYFAIDKFATTTPGFFYCWDPEIVFPYNLLIVPECPETLAQEQCSNPHKLWHPTSTPATKFEENIAKDTSMPAPIEELILRGPRSSSFWFLRNLSNHMDRQARTRDPVSVKSRALTGRSQTLLLWLRGGGRW
jgi:hypothetical protein